MKASEHRPSRVLVDLEAIRENFQRVKGAFQRPVTTFAVVKANAYGHGAVAVARALSGLADSFAVSNLDEALELRQAGIQETILVLGVIPPSEVSLAVAHQISLALASQEWLDLLDLSAREWQQVRFHLKLDTGMGRIGFRKEDEVLATEDFLRQKGVALEGVFTHFATADEADSRYFEQQLARFKELLAVLPSLPPLVHASNSAASIWHADTVFNAVRLGDVLYGLNPSGRTLEMPYPIDPALSLETELVHVKQVEKGAAIGYGSTYHATETEWIGTLPIGYADGVERAMKGFSVLLDGQRVPIVGRVSMDQITIRLPQVYPLGTKVTLIGRQGQEEVTVQDWADHVGTINYEIVCLLSDRLPRIY